MCLPRIENQYSSCDSYSFHYLSNSPYEIFGVLRDYLSVTGFPPGSMRLKEYGGGSSLLGGLWESAASRKRGGAEELLKVRRWAAPPIPYFSSSLTIIPSQSVVSAVRHSLNRKAASYV